MQQATIHRSGTLFRISLILCILYNLILFFAQVRQLDITFINSCWRKMRQKALAQTTLLINLFWVSHIKWVIQINELASIVNCMGRECVLTLNAEEAKTYFYLEIIFFSRFCLLTCGNIAFEIVR